MYDSCWNQVVIKTMTLCIKVEQTHSACNHFVSQIFTASCTLPSSHTQPIYQISAENFLHQVTNFLLQKIMTKKHKIFPHEQAISNAKTNSYTSNLLHSKCLPHFNDLFRKLEAIWKWLPPGPVSKLAPGGSVYHGGQYGPLPGVLQWQKPSIAHVLTGSSCGYYVFISAHQPCIVQTHYPMSEPCSWCKRIVLNLQRYHWTKCH